LEGRRTSPPPQDSRDLIEPDRRARIRGDVDLNRRNLADHPGDSLIDVWSIRKLSLPTGTLSGSSNPRVATNAAFALRSGGATLG